MKSLVIASIFFAVAACGGHGEGDIDEVVGAACATDRDCDSRCYLDNKDFPGGFCSLSCQTDKDCPIDTYCMSTAGGVCLYACPPFDCNRLGPAWTCRDKSRETGGTVSVCIGD